MVGGTVVGGTVGGTVVGTVARGAVVAGAGVVVAGTVEVFVLGAVDVLVEGGRVAVVVLGAGCVGGVVPAVPVRGGEPVARDALVEERVAPSPVPIPSDSGADLVWKLSTPARPAAVARTTMGARLIVVDPAPAP